MLEEVILATKNDGKIKEFKSLLRGNIGNLISLRELESIPEVLESGKTYAENALKKARAACGHFKKACLADDSGLEVDALDGRPGVFSSRYGGNGTNDKGNIRKLLSELHGNDNRRASFVCNLALVCPDGREIIVEGRCDGILLHEPRGECGFGYDPVFFIPELGKTMAELSLEEKNGLSHRAMAVYALISRIEGV